MGEFLMPSLGADMEAGTLIEWEKQVGDEVTRGDIIAVVETQKGAIEIEVFETGVLESQLVEIGKPVPVGTPLARIGTGAEKQVPFEIKSAETLVLDQATNTLAPPLNSNKNHTDTAASFVHDASVHVEHMTTTKTPAGRNEHRRLITPVARRLAAEWNLDIKDIQGSGSNKAIVLKDVESAISGLSEKHTGEVKRSEDARTTETSSKSASVASGVADAGQVKNGMRAAIAAAMTRSKRDIPHYYLSHTVELTTAELWLTKFNADRDASERLLMGVLFLKAVALAALEFPEFNGHHENGVFTAASSVHAGMAINLRGGGLVAPAIHDIDKLDVEALMVKLRDLVMRVRAGRFKATELSDSTLTVSSLGDRGVNSLYGVIYPPQVCIVGFGTPAMRPWISDRSELDIRKVVDVTLAADHRVSDGHRGALFLAAIQKKLQNPEGL